MTLNDREEKVTIVVPIYNAEQTIYSCLKSIMRQTYKNLEIILVNDGSTDRSFHICEQFVKTDFRFKIVNQKNLGPSAARNYGISLATGTYIQFVDADDLVKKTMTETLLNEIKKSNDLVLCGYNVRRGKRRKRVIPPMIGTLPHKQFCHLFGELYLNDLLPSPCNKLYQTNIIKKNELTFPAHINIGEDLLFNLAYLNHCEKIAICKQPLYIYNDYDDSLSKQTNEHYFEMQLLLINKVREFLIENDSYTNNNQRVLHIIFTQSIINTFSQLFIQYQGNKQQIKQAIKRLRFNEAIKNNLDLLTGSYQATILKWLLLANFNEAIYLFLKLKQTMKTKTNRLYQFLQQMNEQSKRKTI